MRLLMFLVLAVIGLVAAGILHFQKNGDTIQISVDKDEFKKDADKVLKIGAKLVHDAEDSLDKARETK